MPLYEYQCKKCKHRFERLQQMSSAPVKKCPECGGAVEKQFSTSSVQFKGSGFYQTDYGRKASGDSLGAGSATEASSGDKKAASADLKAATVDDSSASKAVEKTPSKDYKAKSESRSDSKKSQKR